METAVDSMAHRGVGRVPMGIFLATNYILFYIFQVEKRFVHANLGLPFLIFHPKCDSRQISLQTLIFVI